MRILMVLTQPLDPTTGGVQMSTVKMARMLSGQGDEVAVYSFARSGHADTRHAKLFTAPEAGNLGNRANHSALAGCLQDYSPDVVINQMAYEHVITDTLEAHSTAARIGVLRNTLFSVRNNLNRYADSLLPARLGKFVKNPIGRFGLLLLHKRRHARDLRRILKSYDRFVMFAKPNLAELAYFVNDYDRRKVALIPNSIPSVAAEVPTKQKRILWLARVSEHQKRADLILPLWRRINSELTDWRMDVVGDGLMLDVLRSQAVEEGLTGIQFHGRQPSQPFLEKASIFVMTSDFEGFANTLIEAQSQGAVPVAFDTFPMLRWIVNDGRDAVVVPKDDVDGMATVVTDLAKTEDRRYELARGALVNAERFTESTVAGLWGQLVEEVVGAREKSRK